MVFLGQLNVHNTPSAVSLPGGELFGRHNFVGGNLKIFVWIGSELSEEIFRLVILIGSPKPGHRDDMNHAGNAPDLVTIVNRKKVRQRDLVPRHNAQRGVRRSFIDIKTAPDAKHDTEQKQRERNADDRQQTSALVAKG